MLCIVERDADKEIIGWIIATDIHDAQRQATTFGKLNLAQALSRMEFPRAGKHELPDGLLMLVVA